MADAALTPQQAAQALKDIAGYEEGLTARVGALTGMVWGIVSAAIFVTYGVAPHVSPMWLMPFLWVPWAVAGTVVTRAAWKLHAITLRRGVGGHSWRWTLGFAGLFTLALLGLHFLRIGAGAFPYMVVVNGLALFIIAALVTRRRGRIAAAPLAAGLVVIAGAFALSALHLSSLGMAFASAALVGTCFIGSGLLAFVRG